MTLLSRFARFERELSQIAHGPGGLVLPGPCPFQKGPAVALFDSGSLAYQGTTVTTSVTQVFSLSPGGTALTSPYGVVVQNQGTASIWVGGSSVTAAAAGGPIVGPGQYMYISGTAQTLYAITAAGSSVVAAGLASVAAVV